MAFRTYSDALESHANLAGLSDRQRSDSEIVIREMVQDACTRVLGQCDAQIVELVARQQQVQRDLDQTDSALTDLKRRAERREITAAQFASEYRDLQRVHATLATATDVIERACADVARREDDPLAYLDGLLQKFPAMRRPWWPW